jgi:carboxypeptidase Q
MKLIAIALALAACEPQAAAPKAPDWVSDTSTFRAGSAAASAGVADRYRAVAQKIIAEARSDRGAYIKLDELTTTIGHRLAGSPELDQAIAWAAKAMKADGLEAHTEKVMVPHWARGAEEAAIVTPQPRQLHLIGLGGSVATPKGGITAPIVVVHDWKELDANKDRIKGAIVVYDVPMPAWTEEHGSGYGQVVPFRFAGPSQAGKLGAVAVLVRSVTARSLATPHTGALGYADDPADLIDGVRGQPKIPAAALTVEDTELVARLAKRGPVTIHLRLDEQMLPDVESANVIGELPGTDKRDEVVVIGGHIDSWDVGQGAHDDGAGIVTMMEVGRVLKQLKLQPRRTIRIVLFTNEENGVRGAKAYAKDHAAELPKTVLAVESDSGGFSPRGFSTGHKDAEAGKRMRARIAEITTLLAELHATRVGDGHGGTDIGAMADAGVPQVGLDVDNRLYFDYHHTEADTLDKVDPQQLADDVAAVAVLAYVVADLPDRVDAP